MANEGDPGSSRRRRLFGGAIVAMVVAMLGVGLAITRGDVPPVSTALDSSQPATTTTPPTDPRDEVVARLREILGIRDQALSRRNTSLLDDIYTVDCSCLEDGRALIQQLRREKLVWKGLRTTAIVRDAERVNSRLWTVVAEVRTPAVRIETESGQLVRVVPPERNRVRFDLAKPVNASEWLLGHAAAFEEG